jgi:hypothetical protein
MPQSSWAWLCLCGVQCFDLLHVVAAAHEYRRPLVNLGRDEVKGLQCHANVTASLHQDTDTQRTALTTERSKMLTRSLPVKDWPPACSIRNDIGKTSYRTLGNQIRVPLEIKTMWEILGEMCQMSESWHQFTGAFRLDSSCLQGTKIFLRIVRYGEYQQPYCKPLRVCISTNDLVLFFIWATPNPISTETGSSLKLQS